MPTGVYERKNRIDMSGQIIGYTKVVSLNRRTERADTYWNCVCLYKGCGNHFVRSRHALLKHKEDANCGCYCKEKSAKGKHKYLIEHSICMYPHGKRLRGILDAMKKRCYKPYAKSYKDYGAKGVKICDEWLNDPFAFYNWAMANGYSDELTIDRIDPMGNYEPDNCRWVDFYTQNNNRRDTVKYDFEGESLTLAEISRKVGVNYTTIKERIRRGYSLQDAVIKEHLQTKEKLKYSM